MHFSNALMKQSTDVKNAVSVRTTEPAENVPLPKEL